MDKLSELDWIERARISLANAREATDALLADLHRQLFDMQMEEAKLVADRSSAHQPPEGAYRAR